MYLFRFAYDVIFPNRTALSHITDPVSQGSFLFNTRETNHKALSQMSSYATELDVVTILCCCYRCCLMLLMFILLLLSFILKS